MRLFPNCRAAACRHATVRLPVERVAPNALASSLPSRRPLGFTLVEVLVGATLSAAVMAAVLSSYIYMGRGLARLANQQTLEAEGRRTLALFARDVRMANTVVTVSSSPSSPAANRVDLDLTLPTDPSTNTITYYYNNTPSATTVTINGNSIAMPANSLTRCVDNGTSVSAFTLLRLRNAHNTSVATRSDLTIRFYDSSGNEYTSYTDYLPGIKQLTIEFSSTNGNNRDDTASSQSAGYSAKSARIILRNRALLQ